MCAVALRTCVCIGMCAACNMETPPALVVRVRTTLALLWDSTAQKVTGEKGPVTELKLDLRSFAEFSLGKHRSRVVPVACRLSPFFGAATASSYTSFIGCHIRGACSQTLTTFIASGVFML